MFKSYFQVYAYLCERLCTGLAGHISMEVLNIFLIGIQGAYSFFNLIGKKVKLNNSLLSFIQLWKV